MELLIVPVAPPVARPQPGFDPAGQKPQEGVEELAGRLRPPCEVSAVRRPWAARKRQRDQLDILVGGFTPGN